MKIFGTIIIAFMLLGNSRIPNQKPANFEGEVFMKVNYTYFPPELERYRDYMPTEMKFRFKGKKFRKEGPTGMGGYQIYINDMETRTGIVALAVTGGKIAYRTGRARFAEAEQNRVKPESIEYKEETKTIAGYVCHKALVRMPGISKPLTVYYTEAIPAYGSDTFPGLKGFPLYFEMANKGITYYAEAITVKAIPQDDHFFDPPEGYQMLSEEQFKEALIGADQ